jgi:hypothetical protein
MFISVTLLLLRSVWNPDETLVAKNVTLIYINIRAREYFNIHFIYILFIHDAISIPDFTTSNDGRIDEYIIGKDVDEAFVT